MALTTEMKYGIALFVIASNLLSFGAMYIFIPIPSGPYIPGGFLFLYYLSGFLLLAGSICLGAAITFLIRGSEYNEYIRSTFGLAILSIAVLALVAFVALWLLGVSSSLQRIAIGPLVVGVILLIPGLTLVFIPKRGEQEEAHAQLDDGEIW